MQHKDRYDDFAELNDEREDWNTQDIENIAMIPTLIILFLGFCVGVYLLFKFL